MLHGGPIARAFVAALPEDFRAQRFRVRSKLQWLKQGWLTAGVSAPWHCDQVAARGDGEQDYQRRATPGRHTIGAAVGDISLTRFLVGEYELPDYPEGVPQGLLWNEAIEDGLRRGAMTAATVPEGALVRFGELDFHKPMPAVRTGWRIFIRATLDDSERRGDVGGWNRVTNDFFPTSIHEYALYAPYATR
jgi:hypothetical protein